MYIQVPTVVVSGIGKDVRGFPLATESTVVTLNPAAEMSASSGDCCVLVWSGYRCPAKFFRAGRSIEAGAAIGALSTPQTASRKFGLIPGVWNSSFPTRGQHQSFERMILF